MLFILLRTRELWQRLNKVANPNRITYEFHIQARARRNVYNPSESSSRPLDNILRQFYLQKTTAFILITFFGESVLYEHRHQ